MHKWNKLQAQISFFFLFLPVFPLFLCFYAVSNQKPSKIVTIYIDKVHKIKNLLFFHIKNGAAAPLFIHKKCADSSIYIDIPATYFAVFFATVFSGLFSVISSKTTAVRAGR